MSFKAATICLALAASSAVLAGQQPSLTLPTTLERQIPRLTLQLGPDGQRIAGAIQSLLSSVDLPPMGVESEPSLIYRLPPPAADPRMRTIPPAPATLTVGPGSLGAALQTLRGRLPQYDIWVEDGVIGIAPSRTHADARHFLNAPIAFFRVKDMTFHRAVTTLLNQLEPSIRISDWRENPTTGSYIVIGPVPPPDVEASTRRYMERPVTLSVTNTSPRDILNRLVAQHGEMIWVATYEDPRADSLPQAVQSNCVVTFFPTAHGTWPATVSLRTTAATASSVPGAVPQAAPRPPAQSSTPMSVPASAPPGGTRVVLNLPPQPENLVTVGVRLGAATRRIFGIEVVTSMPPAPPPSGERRTYDLTGLPISEALNKMIEFLPSYDWSADGDVFHIRPKGVDGPATTVLDRRVPKFAGRFENLQLATRAVAVIIEQGPTSVRPGANGAGAGGVSAAAQFSAPGPTHFPPASWSDEIKALVTRPVEVDLSNVTIRQILDEMARKHGAMSWAVIYRGSIEAPDGLQLGFMGFEQWSVNTTTRIGR